MNNIQEKGLKILGQKNKKLYIVGASGHGKVIADMVVQGERYQDYFFLDDDLLKQQKGIVVGDSSYAISNKESYDVIIAVGNGAIRKALQEQYEEAGVNIISLIHSNAILASNITLGRGTVVMAGAVLQPHTEIGRGVIINTASSVDHECKIGDFAHVSVGSHLAGNVIIGEETWVGTGAIISNNISVCNNVMLGAGTVVVRDITESGTYVGVPATKIR